MSSLESQTATFDDQEDSHQQYAMQLASASVLPMVLKSAVELKLLEIIAKAGPSALLSPFEIATHLQITTNPEAHLLLDRILRLLASYSILTCTLSTNCTHGQQEEDNSNGNSSSSRLYGLAPVAKYFIPNQDGLSFAPMLHLIQDKVNVNMWYHLVDAVMEGGVPFNRAYGMNALDYVGNDARCRGLFKSFTGDYNSMFMKQILETYRGFEGLNSIVDVGGGDGAILNMIVSKYPTIKGINFDRARVIEKSPSYSGIENVAGDMFMSIPRGDAIFMKWILHNWDDEHCLIILQNCFKSLPDNGKVIVVDMAVPEKPETDVAAKSDFQLDLFLMNMNPGGKERTKGEFEKLGKKAGFSSVKLAARAYNFSLVEFYKTI